MISDRYQTRVNELKKHGIPLPEGVELSKISEYCDRKCSKCLVLINKGSFFLFLLIICKVLSGKEA